jgi:hypothetical protein
MAERALFIESLLPAVERMRELGDGDEEGWANKAHDAKVYRDMYITIAHGEPFGGITSRYVSIVDSSRELASFRRKADEWQAEALRLVRTLRQQDPQWFATWGGPRRKA